MDQFTAKMEQTLSQASLVAAYARKVAPNIDRIHIVSSGTGWSFMKSVLLKLVDDEAEVLEARAFMSANYFVSPPKKANEKTLLMVASVSGATDDALRAIETVKDKVHGSIVFTRSDTSPLASAGDNVFWVGDSEDPYFSICMLMLVFVGTVLEVKEGWSLMPDLLMSLPFLGQAYVSASLESQVRAKEDAAFFKNDQKIYLVSTGYAEALAFVISDCNLGEKLKIHADSIEAARFFHGPQEKITNDMAVLLVLGEDHYQTLMGPVQKFCSENAARTKIYDTCAFKMEGISEKVRPLVSPLVGRPPLKNFVAALAEEKGMELDHRLYYGKKAYTVEEYGDFGL